MVFKNQNYQSLKINLDAYLVIIDTNLSSKTRDSVIKVAQFKEEDEDTFNQVLKVIGVISERAKIALANNDLTLLEKTLCDNQKFLQVLGVSNQIIDQTIEVASKLGLKGLKLTGGGLGGCIIGITNDTLVVHNIKNHFKNVWVDYLGADNESKSIC